MSAHTLQQQAGVLHGRQMVLLVTIGLHALVIAVLMTMKVMPDKIFDGHMKLDALLPDKPVEPPPPQLPVSNPLRSSVPYVPEIPVPVPTLPEESVPTPTQIQLDTGPVATPTEVVGAGAGPQIASTALQYRAVRSADD